MDWAWWLLAPLAVTVTAAVLTWWVNRPRRAPSAERAVEAHRQFLDDLARWSPSPPPPPSPPSPNGASLPLSSSSPTPNGVSPPVERAGA